MTVILTDNQTVGETAATLLVLKGATDLQIIIKNSGSNTMNYRFQEYNGTAWVDLGASGTDFYSTLTASEVKMIQIEATYPHIQIVGNASGGALLEFTAQAEINRASGGGFTIFNA